MMGCVAVSAKTNTKNITRNSPLVSLPMPYSISNTNYYYPAIDIAQYAIHQGNARSSNLIEGFIPLYQKFPQTLSFIDMRFYNPNGLPIEGNIDLGIRRLFHQDECLFGIYGGYDRYRSDTRRYYSQVHAGFEYWNNRFFLGGNGYLPINKKVYDNDAVNMTSLVSTPVSYRYNISYSQGKERALPGVDAEVGMDVNHGLTLYLGGYYFDHSDASSILGPKLRATYTFYRNKNKRLLGLFDRIRLEGLISHDSIRGTSWLFGLRLRFGLSSHANPSIGIERHMTDTLHRDLNVVSENFNTSDQLYRIGGVPVQVDIVSDTSGRTIDAATSGDADIIGVRGSQIASGTLTIGDRDLTITGGQYSFVAGGKTYSVNIGNNAELTTSISDTLFSATGSSDVTLSDITLSNQTTDAGVMLSLEDSFTGTISINNTNFTTQSATNAIIGIDGAVAPQFTDVLLRNINTSSTAPLIHITSDENIEITVNGVELDNLGSGPDILVDEGALEIINSTIVVDQSGPVIDLTTNSQSLTIDNSSITNNGTGVIIKEEIDGDDIITITDSTLVANDASATLDLGGAGDLILTDTSLSNTGTGDLVFHDGALDISLNGTITLNQPDSGDGIVLNSTGAESHTLSDFTIIGSVGGSVISIPSTSNDTLTIQDATITNTSSGDLINHENVSPLVLDNVTLNQTGIGDGIVLGSTSAQTQTFNDDITITGNITNGALISIPDTSLETLNIENATLTNTGTGDLIQWASSTDLTISDGAVLQNTGGGDLISMVGATGALSITGTMGTPITLNVTNGFALETDGNDFDISIEYVNTNAPFDFKLTTTSATGQLTFNNNTLNIADSTALDSNLGGSFAGVILFTDDNQALTVSDFSNNDITITRTDKTSAFGLYAQGNATNPILLTNGFSNNSVELSNDPISSSGILSLVGFHADYVSLDGDFSNNTFDMDGTGGTSVQIEQGVIGLYSDHDFSILNGNNMSNNTFIAKNVGNNGEGAGWVSIDTVSITGDFGGTSAGNTFTANENTSFGWGWYARDTINIGGDVADNIFNASSNGDTGYAWNTEESLTVTGDFYSNTLTASSNDNNGYAWETEDIVSMGNFTNNIFTASSNTGGDGYAWSAADTITINGNFGGKTLTADVNTFTANNNGGSGYAWDTASVSITGDLTGYNASTTNQWIANSNGSEGYGWHSTGVLTVNGDVEYNTFDVSANADSGHGLQSTSDMNIGSLTTNQFRNNTFTLTNNGGNSIGLSIEDNATFQGSSTVDSFTGNTITVTGANNLDNYGMQIDLRANEVADFIGAFTGNTIIGTGKVSSSYGLFLNTQGTGYIRFRENTDKTELETSNNNLIINNYGSDDIRFG